jgi:hypothetical protein
LNLVNCQQLNNPSCFRVTYCGLFAKETWNNSPHWKEEWRPSFAGDSPKKPETLT